MNENYVRKCKEIFEEECERRDINEDLKLIESHLKFEISAEYQYILERYAGKYVQENYGFKGLEKTPLTDKNGYDSVSYFFPMNGKDNVRDKYVTYKEQLPTELIPIAEMDGGNLLCLNRVTNEIYSWIHDEAGKNVHLVQGNMSDFINSFVKIEHEKCDNLGIVEAKFSAGFLEALRNYKG